MKTSMRRTKKNLEEEEGLVKTSWKLRVQLDSAMEISFKSIQTTEVWERNPIIGMEIHLREELRSAEPQLGMKRMESTAHIASNQNHRTVRCPALAIASATSTKNAWVKSRPPTVSKTTQTGSVPTAANRWLSASSARAKGPSRCNWRDTSNKTVSVSAVPTRRQGRSWLRGNQSSLSPNSTHFRGSTRLESLTLGRSSLTQNNQKTRRTQKKNKLDIHLTLQLSFKKDKSVLPPWNKPCWRWQRRTKSQRRKKRRL